MILEIRAYSSYKRIRLNLCYWRSKHGHEVDILIGDDIAIEIKSTKFVTDTHIKSLRYLAEEKVFNRYFLVSHDLIERRQGNIEIIHWQKFLDLLWSDQIVSK